MDNIIDSVKEATGFAKSGRPTRAEAEAKNKEKDKEIEKLYEHNNALTEKLIKLNAEKTGSQDNYLMADPSYIKDEIGVINSVADLQTEETPVMTSQTEAQARWQKSIDARPQRLLEEGETKLIVPPHILDEIREAGYQDFFPLRSQIPMKQSEGWILYTDANGATFEIPSRNGTPGDDHVLMMLPLNEAEAIKQRAYTKARRQTKAIKDKARKGDGGGSYYTPDGARF